MFIMFHKTSVGPTLLLEQTQVELDSMRWFFHGRSPSPPGGTQWYRLLPRAAYGL